MAVIKSVRKHISFLHVDTIIFTRDLLEHGTRVSVDMCLHRLALAGFLRRLSFGMYVRHDCDRNFTPAEIADAKKIWLIQRRLEKLFMNSPGLILSNTYRSHIQSFAPPAMASTNLNRQASFTGAANPTLTPAPR